MLVLLAVFFHDVVFDQDLHVIGVFRLFCLDVKGEGVERDVWSKQHIKVTQQSRVSGFLLAYVRLVLEVAVDNQAVNDSDQHGQQVSSKDKPVGCHKEEPVRDIGLFGEGCAWKVTVEKREDVLAEWQANPDHHYPSGLLPDQRLVLDVPDAPHHPNEDDQKEPVDDDEHEGVGPAQVQIVLSWVVLVNNPKVAALGIEERAKACIRLVHRDNLIKERKEHAEQADYEVWEEPVKKSFADQHVFSECRHAYHLGSLPGLVFLQEFLFLVGGHVSHRIGCHSSLEKVVVSEAWRPFRGVGLKLTLGTLRCRFAFQFLHFASIVELISEVFFVKNADLLDAVHPQKVDH
jgi:hypothetical protein